MTSLIFSSLNDLSGHFFRFELFLPFPVQVPVSDTSISQKQRKFFEKEKIILIFPDLRRKLKSIKVIREKKFWA